MIRSLFPQTSPKPAASSQHGNTDGALPDGAMADLPPVPTRQGGLRRRWPTAPAAIAYQPVSAWGRSPIWVRRDLLAFAVIALGPARVTTIVAALATEPGSVDPWVVLPGGENVRDRSASFSRVADRLFPPGPEPMARVRADRTPTVLDKVQRDPAYDLSDMDDESLIGTYRRFGRRPYHPVALACLRELTRRQTNLAC